MKLFNAIAAPAIISTSLFTATPADAHPSRTVSWTGDTGTDYAVTPVGSNNIELIVNDKYNSTGYVAVRNCGTGQYRWKSNDGFSENQIKNMTRLACNW